MTTILVYTKNTDNNAPNGALHIRFSTDYGANWTAEDKFTDGDSVTGFPMTAEGLSDQNTQSCTVLAPNGNLLLLMWDEDTGPVGGGTFQSISTDSGKTWGTPTLIAILGLSAADNLNTFATDQAVVVGNTIYVSCIHYYDTTYNVLIKSTDNGSTWSYVGKISGNLTTGEAGLEYIGSNTFISILRSSNNNLLVARSTDSGQTWSTPTPFPGYAVGGRCHLWTGAHLRGEANWWTDPVLIMCGFIIEGADSRQNSLWVSLDSGATWEPRFALDTLSGGGGYGDMFYNPNTSEYVAVMHKGPDSAADIKQYNLTIGGI